MKNKIFLFALILISTFSIASNQSNVQSSNRNFKGEIIVNEVGQSEQIKTKLIFYSLREFRSFDITQLDSNLESDAVEIEVTCTITKGKSSDTIKLKATGIASDKIKEKIRSMVAEARAGVVTSPKKSKV